MQLLWYWFQNLQSYLCNHGLRFKLLNLPGPPSLLSSLQVNWIRFNRKCLSGFKCCNSAHRDGVNPKSLTVSVLGELLQICSSTVKSSVTPSQQGSSRIFPHPVVRFSSTCWKGEWLTHCRTVLIMTILIVLLTLKFHNKVFLFLKIIFLFLLLFMLFFLPCCAECGILVPQPGIKPVPPALKMQSLNHWTSRGVPRIPSWIFIIIKGLHDVDSTDKTNRLKG